MASNPTEARCVTRTTFLRCAMRNLLLICLFSFASVSLAQEPVGDPEPVIEEQGASQASPAAEDSASAPEPVIEQKGAQESDPAADPPSRVARLSLTEG